MAGPNWNLALQQTGREALDYTAAFEMGRAATEKQNAVNAQRMSRAKASEQLATGDTSGAQQTAMAGGDFDYAKAIGSFSEDQRKQLDAEADTLGRFAYGIKSLPKEQRERAFMQAVPALRGRFSPEEIKQRYDELKGAGWADEALDGYVNQALSVKDALAEYTKANEQYTLAPGSSRRDAKGNIIAEQPFAPKTLSVSPGEEIIEYQPGGGGQTSGGGGDLSTMLGITLQAESGGRDFAPGGGTLTSPKGAQGRMQVMPGTQGDPGFGVTPAQNRTPDEIARVGEEYLGAMMQRYGGDPAKAWAAYNAGPGALDKALAGGGDWLSKMPRETQSYVRNNVQKLNGGQGEAGSRVIARGAPKQKDAPSGYRWTDNGDTLEPIPGGPGAGRPGGDRKAATDLRKEFNARQEIKDFKEVRSAFQQIASIARNPKATPQDDIALVFSFMKMLDPGSVVREGEFALAGAAAGLPTRITQAMRRVDTGESLTPGQRAEMLLTAKRVYDPREATYNRIADEFQSYAKDYGVDPNTVARKYVPPKRKAAVPADIQGLLRKYGGTK